MKILFDHCVPKPLRRHLIGHEIKTAYQIGWDTLKNGNLPDAAQAQFDVLIYREQNIVHQQKVEGRHFTLVVLVASDNKVATLIPLVLDLLALFPNIVPGNVYQIQREVPCP